MVEVHLEDNPEVLLAQEERRAYLANRKIKNINCSYARDEQGNLLNCHDCLYWEKCLSKKE